ncbi:hypothetical protein, variant [Saprolegnia diclina VS20]|nr:hypothetical protein, variant [Saprolegnia diclina VS20]EQC26972.1 hypothetical protein, variant [Saprolegnia diclina VS20]|eukprot:XP_008619573.1 hypothetical protein, variant [Saprolegnia diclina VS20]
MLHFVQTCELINDEDDVDISGSADDDAVMVIDLDDIRTTVWDVVDLTVESNDESDDGYEAYSTELYKSSSDDDDSDMDPAFTDSPKKKTSTKTRKRVDGVCFLCDKPADGTKPGVYCGGCERVYHTACAIEYGQEAVCWECEEREIIDDDELSETDRDRTHAMLHGLREVKKEPVANAASARPRVVEGWRQFLDEHTAPYHADFERFTREIENRTGFSTTLEADLQKVFCHFADQQIKAEALEAKQQAAHDAPSDPPLLATTAAAVATIFPSNDDDDRRVPPAAPAPIFKMTIVNGLTKLVEQAEADMRNAKLRAPEKRSAAPRVFAVRREVSGDGSNANPITLSSDSDDDDDVAPRPVRGMRAAVPAMHCVAADLTVSDSNEEGASEPTGAAGTYPAPPVLPTVALAPAFAPTHTQEAEDSRGVNTDYPAPPVVGVGPCRRVAPKASDATYPSPPRLSPATAVSASYPGPPSLPVVQATDDMSYPAPPVVQVAPKPAIDTPLEADGDALYPAPPSLLVKNPANNLEHPRGELPQTNSLVARANSDEDAYPAPPTLMARVDASSPSTGSLYPSPPRLLPTPSTGYPGLPVEADDVLYPAPPAMGTRTLEAAPRVQLEADDGDASCYPAPPSRCVVGKPDAVPRPAVEDADPAPPTLKARADAASPSASADTTYPSPPRLRAAVTPTSASSQRPSRSLDVDDDVRYPGPPRLPLVGVVAAGALAPRPADSACDNPPHVSSRDRPTAALYSGPPL